MEEHDDIVEKYTKTFLAFICLVMSTGLLSATENLNNNNIHIFVNAYKSSLQKCTHQNNIQGVVGRVIRGKSAHDFTTLSNDPKRFVIMMIDADGLQGLLCLNGYTILKKLGYSNSDIHKFVTQEGLHFKLIVTEPSNKIVLATWDNIPDVLYEAYKPIMGETYARNLQQKIKNAIPALKIESLNSIESSAGYQFGSIKENDPRYMTADCFMASKGSIIDARAFLFHTIQLREEYRGDGYTTGGLHEYFSPNVSLKKLGKYQTIDLEVNEKNISR
jgi:hypothetical protein